VQAFISCSDVDDLYFDRPYYLAPSGAPATEAFSLIREGMWAKKVAALARAVLFRRVRSVLIRTHDCGLIATMLNFDYDSLGHRRLLARSPKQKSRAMLDLARHIIETKRGTFDLANLMIAMRRL
jgi:DNA end-binding protein Ku